MNPSMPSSSVREQLVHQLVVLGEEKNRFLDAFFPMAGKVREEMDQFLGKYTLSVEKLLSFPDDHLQTVVLVGSSVNLVYVQDQMTDQFTIVFPQHVDPDDNRISFLSPVGRQLLLAIPGDELTLSTPSGRQQVKIDGTHFVGAGLPQRGLWP